MLVALATTVVLAGIVTIPTAQADDEKDLRDRQESVQGQIDSTSTELEESSSQARAASAALEQATAELGDARTRLASVQEQLEEARGLESQLQAKLVDTEATLATARQELAAGEVATAAQRGAVAATISSIYERGDPQLLAFAAILKARTPADVTRQMNFNDVVVGKQDTAYADLRAAEAALRDRENDVAKAKRDVADQRDAAVQRVQAIETLRAQAGDAENEVVSLVSARERARADAEAAKSADLAQLEELRTQEADIKKQILRAKRIAERAARAAAARAAAANQAAPSTNGLVGGQLLAPVDGRITSPFGYRIHPIYGYWGLHDGTDFGVACGEGLRAAGDGTVLSTYYSSSYGNRLYLDLGIVDGKALTVVYNHMSGYATSPGDVVKAADIVGYVGSTGWSTGCHLHFTVLEDGTAVDPMNYL